MENNFVGGLGLVVGLWVFYWACDVLDVKFFVKLDQSSVGELSTVVMTCGIPNRHTIFSKQNFGHYVQ